jgi:hypothetical protein
MSRDLHLRHPQRRLIIGGHDIVHGRYPYFCSIDKNNGVVLNGALIAPDIVLTAGHITLNNMNNLTLKVGAFAVHGNESTAAEEIPVKAWIVHANWSQFATDFFANDFCLLKLARTTSIPPIQLNRDPVLPVMESAVHMLGLGWTNETALSPSNIVQEVKLITIGNDDCERAMDPVRNLTYHDMIVPSMLCTVAPPNTTRDGWYVRARRWWCAFCC